MEMRNDSPNLAIENMLLDTIVAMMVEAIAHTKCYDGMAIVKTKVTLCITPNHLRFDKKAPVAIDVI